jgi:hypothetical protein
MTNVKVEEILEQINMRKAHIEKDKEEIGILAKKGFELLFEAKQQ